MSVAGTAFSIATIDDMPYIVDLEYKNKESLGFLPSMAISERVAAGRVFIGRLNGDPFGYLLFDWRGGGRHVHVLQACIQYDARRRLYGAALYGFGLQMWQPMIVTLKCAADLESNVFWRSLGLLCTAVVTGGSRRKRKINIWTHVVEPEGMLFQPSGVLPAFQRREDCKDAQTGFMVESPEGFADMGDLGKLAWSNRKPKG